MTKWMNCCLGRRTWVSDLQDVIVDAPAPRSQSQDPSASLRAGSGAPRCSESGFGDGGAQFDALGGNGDFGRRKLGAVPAFLDGFDIDLAGTLRGLHDDLREAVEERALRFFVALLAIGIAVANADECAFTGNLES